MSEFGQKTHRELADSQCKISLKFSVQTNFPYT